MVFVFNMTSIVSAVKHELTYYVISCVCRTYVINTNIKKLNVNGVKQVKHVNTLFELTF